MRNIIRRTKSEMKVEREHEDLLYNKHVISKIVEGADPDAIGEAYWDYIEDMNGFRVHAFDKTIDTILEDHEGIIQHFSKGFDSIPEYLIHRGGWLENLQDIKQGGGPAHVQDMSYKSLDRMRTAAHDDVIDLFNDINEYAKSREIPSPYLKRYGNFDKKNRDHRRDVADILINHSPLFENVNQLVVSREMQSSENYTDKYKGKSLGKLLEMVGESGDIKDLPVSYDEEIVQ